MSQVSRRSAWALRLLREQIRTQGSRYVFFIIATVIVAGVDLLPPRVFQFFTENIATLESLSEASAADFLRSFFLFGAIVTLTVFLTNVTWDIAQEWILLQSEASLRRSVLRRLHSAPLETLDEAQRGDWLTRVSGDLRGVEQFIASELPLQIRSLLILIGVTITFLWHGGAIAAALLGSAVILVLINIYIQMRVKPWLEQLRVIHGDILQGLLESYEGLPTIRSLGAEGFVAGEFEKKVKTVITRGFRLIRVTSFVGGGNGFTVSFLTALCLTLVAWRVKNDGMTIADALIYPFYIGMFYSSALTVVGMLAEWNQFLVEGGRLAEFLYDDGANSPVVATELPPPAAAIALRQVHVAFHGTEPLTQPFDLQITRGKILVIRGPSGCGKSTFLEMLAGLRTVPSGQLEVSNSGEKENDAYEAPMRLPLTWSAYVEQRPYLFEGTLRTNLAPSLGDIDETHLWQSLNQVNLAGFVRKMGGLDYVLRDMGKNLSEGEKYRLVLARALLLDRPYLLLDEPFASLDPFSIMAVCQALSNQRAMGRGIVIVTHVVPSELAVDRTFDFQTISTAIDSLMFEDETKGLITHVSPRELARLGANTAGLARSELI